MLISISASRASLPSKCRYRAGPLTPTAAPRSAMLTPWKPCLANSSAATARIWARLPEPRSTMGVAIRTGCPGSRSAAAVAHRYSGRRTLAPRWLRARAGVRAASALSAAAVVALALVVAGVALILLVGQSLSRSVETDAVQKAQAIADRMHGNYGKRVNGTYTPKENAVEALDTLMGRGDPALAQIIVDYSDDQDGSGWALQEGSDNGSLGPMSDLAPNTRDVIVVPSAYVPDRGGTMHAALVAVGGITTTTDQMHFVVLYAAPLAAVDAAQDTVMFYLSFGVPLLILVVGAATYFFAGRALRPVEAIRAQVASMSEKDLAERVPVPVARDEVGRLAETMNGMIARLESAQKVQRRFVADASHELRSPLATIGAGLELLEGSDPGTVRTLRGETERLGRLVDDLLLLARADEQIGRASCRGRVEISGRGGSV